MVKPWCVAAGVFLFLAATSVSAQRPGDRVRVSGNVVGEVVEVDSAGLLLSAGYSPYAGMRSLEVWVGTGTKAGRWFMKGFVSGGAVGMLTGVGFCYIAGCDAAGFVKAGSALGGLYGTIFGVVGALIGSRFKTDIWIPVPIPGGLSLRVAVGGT